MFLSPCIAKKDEIEDKNTYGYVKYNITFKKLKEYIEKNNINLNYFNEVNFEKESSLGFLFSRPGGLKENIEAYDDSLWIRQIEGQKTVYPYLGKYLNRVGSQKKVPLLVDALNCEFGCNIGTGTEYTNISIDDIDFNYDR